MRKQSLLRRPQFEVLEDRMALNATMIPQVDAGPPFTMQAGSLPPVIALQGGFVDPEINVFDHATAKFFLSKVSDGTLVQFGTANVDSLRRTISYELTQPAPGDYLIELDMTYGNLTGSGQTILHLLPSLVPTTPIVDAGPDVSMSEGAQPNVVHMFGTFSDPSATYMSYLSSMFYVYRTTDGSLEQAGSVQVDIQRRTLLYDVVQIPAGDYTIKLQLTDRLLTGEGVTHLHVWPNYPPPVPHAPSVVAPVSGSIKEGGVYVGTYSFSDPDGGPWNVRVDFGNGSAPLVLNNVRQSGAFNLSAVYVRNSVAQPDGVYHGTITVTDSTGLSSNASFTVLVRAETPVLRAPSSIVVSGRNGWYTPVTVSYSETSNGGRLSAFFLVRNQLGQIVEAGNGTINPYTHKIVFVLRLLPPGKYTIEFYMNHDGAIGHTQSNLQELPFWNPRIFNMLFALYGRRGY